MSAQTRYRTLVANTGAIYAAGQEGRTTLLQKGLDDIVGAIQPMTAEQWNLVKTDSERLLKVWFSKEKEQGPAAEEVVSQLLDLLKELASPPTPTIVIADKISHVHDYPVAKEKKAVVVEVVEEEEVEEEEEEEEVEEEEEEEVEEEEEDKEVVEEEEGEGMEVEQVQLRGRTYWLDVNTKRLYANTDDDDVGDEVGSMINGKPVFLSK